MSRRDRAAIDRWLGRCATAAITVSVAFVGSVYVGLPAGLALCSVLRPRPIRTTGRRPTTISVIVAAHNEADAIEQKLTDVAAQQIEGDPDVEVIVASDGSTDATVALAETHPLRATILDLARGGKAAAMNAALDHSSGEIVIFTDANSRLGPEAFERLTEAFADPDVGGVAGDQRYHDLASGTADAERSYWSYERILKQLESSVGNVVSSTGTLHAVRRALIDDIPPDVTDDFFVSTGVVQRHRRLVFAPGAIAWERPNETAGAEYRRRVRIITRGLTGVRRRKQLLNPVRHGGYSLVLFVHKVARRMVFVPLILCLVGSSLKARENFVWQVAFAGQAAFYGVAGIGVLWPRSKIGRHRLVALPGHFCVANAAAAHAIWNVITGRSYVTWTPERS